AWCASRIMARPARLGPVVSVSKTIFAHRPPNHLRRVVATVRKNVSNLRSGVIESLRAVHDKIGATALFGIRHICDQIPDASANDKTVPRRCFLLPARAHAKR